LEDNLVDPPPTKVFLPAVSSAIEEWDLRFARQYGYDALEFDLTPWRQDASTSAPLLLYENRSLGLVLKSKEPRMVTLGHSDWTIIDLVVGPAEQAINFRFTQVSRDDYLIAWADEDDRRNGNKLLCPTWLKVEPNNTVCLAANPGDPDLLAAVGGAAVRWRMDGRTLVNTTRRNDFNAVVLGCRAAAMASAPAIAVAKVDDMKPAAIRRALEIRGLDPRGKKMEARARLKAALRDEGAAPAVAIADG
jgi:hypothetical protein